MEGLQFSVRMRDSSLTRRGFLWWAVVEGLCAAGVPVMEVAPQQIKQFATGKGNASKTEMVAAYVKAWPDAPVGRNVEDRADRRARRRAGICLARHRGPLAGAHRGAQEADRQAPPADAAARGCFERPERRRGTNRGRSARLRVSPPFAAVSIGARR